MADNLARDFEQWFDDKRYKIDVRLRKLETENDPKGSSRCFRRPQHIVSIPEGLGCLSFRRPRRSQRPSSGRTQRGLPFERPETVLSLGSGLDDERSMVGIQSSLCTDWHRESVGAVPHWQTAEYWDAEWDKPIAQDINDGPSACFVETRKLADRDPADTIQVTSFQQPGKMPVDMTEAFFNVLNQQDGSLQIGQNPTCRGGYHVEVAAQKYATGLSASGQNRGGLVGPCVDGNSLGSQDGTPKRLRGRLSKPIRVPTGTVDTGDTGMMPQCQMQDRDLTEANHKFWVSLHGGKVEAVGNSIGPLFLHAWLSAPVLPDR